MIGRKRAIAALDRLVELQWLAKREKVLSHYGRVSVYAPVPVRALMWQEEMAEAIGLFHTVAVNCGTLGIHKVRPGEYVVQPLHDALPANKVKELV